MFFSLLDVFLYSFSHGSVLWSFLISHWPQWYLSTCNVFSETVIQPAARPCILTSAHPSSWLSQIPLTLSIFSLKLTFFFFFVGGLSSLSFTSLFFVIAGRFFRFFLNKEKVFISLFYASKEREREKMRVASFIIMKDHNQQWVFLVLMQCM